MNQSRAGLAVTCLAVFGAMLATDVSTVLGQQSLGLSGGRAYYGRSNQRASRSMSHARDYSRDLYQYSRDSRPIDRQFATSESTELGRNIAAAQKEFTTIREEFAGDQETLADLKVVEEHLAMAAAKQQTLHAECQKDSVHGTASMECCNVITGELEKAMAKHAEMLRNVEIRGRAKSEDPSSTKKNS